MLRSSRGSQGRAAAVSVLSIIVAISLFAMGALSEAAARGGEGPGGDLNDMSRRPEQVLERSSGPRPPQGYRPGRGPRGFRPPRWGFRGPPRQYNPPGVVVEEVIVRRPRRVARPPETPFYPQRRNHAIVAGRANRPPAKPIVRPPRRRPPQAVASASPPTFVPGEVLCEVDGAVSVAAVDRIVGGYGLRRLSYQRLAFANSTLYRYAIRNGRSVAGVVRALQADKRISSAQPNYLFRLQDETGGSALASAQYTPAKLHLAEAHRSATGQGVVVAVIDSGVDGGHPELAGAIEANVNALSSEARPDPHGTAIAGIIAAHAQLVGVAPAAKILAIRAFVSDAATLGAMGRTSDIVRAISIAAEAGARVVNMSFSGPSDPLLARVIAAGRKGGILFVAAAGNAGPTAAPSYPAADPDVIAVTATDSADALFPGANRGSYISVSAPGVDVLVAAPGQGYALSSGTSVAAAHVSGVLALVLQRRPDLTPDEALRILTESSRDLGPPGRDDSFGAGLVDAERSMEEVSKIAAKGKAVAPVPGAAADPTHAGASHAP